MEKINKDTHLVVMVGTNNIKSGGTENILRKYKELVGEMKLLNCRKLSIIGILTRGDEDEYFQGKRMSINLRLEKLCEEQEIEFMDPVQMYDSICTRENLNRNVIELQVLDKFGLHLNEWGEDQIARTIFKHCIKFIYLIDGPREGASNIQTSESEVIKRGRTKLPTKCRSEQTLVGGKMKLKCFYANARSIINKRQELEMYIMEEQPDVVGITESWAVASIEDSELALDGYTMLRKDRIVGDKTKGGGVLLYVKNSLQIVLREDVCNSEFPECVWGEIVIGTEKTLIGVCYRPPDSSKAQDDALYRMIREIKDKNILLMGDFNFPDINWKESERIDDSHPFLQCIGDKFLTQCVDENTRSKNVLDLIFGSEENMIEELKVGEPFGTSDHQIIRWQLVAYSGRIKHVAKNKTHNYFKANYDQMREEANAINWSAVIRGLDCEEDYLNFKLEMNRMRDKFVPLNRKKIGKCMWVTKAVVKARRAKIKSWKKFQQTKTEQNKSRYEIKLANSRKQCRKAKREFEKKLAENSKENSKSFYAYVRSKQRTKDTVGPLKDQNGNVITNDIDQANLLNEYFGSVYTIEDLSRIPEPLEMFEGKLDEEGLVDIDITEEMVERKLSKLNPNKCPGLDGLHPKMLFELRNIISKPLSIIYRTSLKTGVVPTDWREAGVSPLFKKGKKCETQNYRPVSMTSLICKVMESIIKDAMIQMLYQFKLIRDSQHGFTKGRSCLTNLLDFLEEVSVTMDVGLPVDVVYLDFAKAFDKVPHKRLSKKLQAHGIGGRVLEWIDNWLGNRRQKVGVNGVYSNWKSVLSGVPQGSVLGPLLFVIYINDLDVDIVSKLSKFADDTKLARGVGSDSEAKSLSDDLDKIYQWSVDWQMLFNTEKCTVMHMGLDNKEREYLLGGKILKKSKQESDLGVIMDATGKASQQCIQAVKKANAILGMIKRNMVFRSKLVVVKLYKALVRPRLEYCVQAWSPYTRKEILMLERVQKRATRLIEGYREYDYETRLRKTGLMSLEKRRVRGDLIQVFKMLKGFDKMDSTKFFKLAGNGKTRGNSFKIKKTRSRSERRRNSFSQRVINSWNRLPQEVVNAESINCFKNRLDKYGKF